MGSGLCVFNHSSFWWEVATACLLWPFLFSLPAIRCFCLPVPFFRRGVSSSWCSTASLKDFPEASDKIWFIYWAQPFIHPSLLPKRSQVQPEIFFSWTEECADIIFTLLSSSLLGILFALWKLSKIVNKNVRPSQRVPAFQWILPILPFSVLQTASTFPVYLNCIFKPWYFLREMLF